MKQAVFFDLDGTLLDTRPGIFRCVRHMLRELDAGERTDVELMAIIGPPLSVGFSRILGTDDAALVERAVEIYRAEYAAAGMYEARVYAGIEELCERLRADGVLLRVVTSKAQVFAEKIVARFGLDRYFARVYGPDLSGNHADKTELIAHVLESEKVIPGNTAMIGDREYDMIGARANGVFAVGALWGFGSEAELEAAGAEVLASDPSAVIENFL